VVARDHAVMSASKMVGGNREKEGRDRRMEQVDDRTLNPLDQEPELGNALPRDHHNRKRVAEGNPLRPQHNDSREAVIREIEFRRWVLYNHHNRHPYTPHYRTFALSRIQT